MNEPSPVAGEAAAVKARNEALVAAEAAFDVATMMEFYAEDAILQAPAAPQIQGKSGIRDVMSQLFGGGVFKKFSAQASHIEVSATGDLAWDVGINRMVLPGDAGDFLDVGKYLFVWKKIDGPRPTRRKAASETTLVSLDVASALVAASDVLGASWPAISMTSFSAGVSWAIRSLSVSPSQRRPHQRPPYPGARRPMRLLAYSTAPAAPHPPQPVSTRSPRPAPDCDRLRSSR